MRALILIAVLLGSVMSFACKNDSDCFAGQVCSDTSGYGYCKYNEQPYVTNPNRGRSCSTDYDCGSGYSCVKQFGQFQGMCQ